MGRKYTAAEVQAIVRDRLTNNDINKLYDADFLNWSGITADESRRPLTEVVAEELARAFERLLCIGKGLEPRVKALPDHDGSADCASWLEKRPDILSEKHMARALANSPCQHAFGRIIGYEIPLRQSNGGKLGAVDLFALAGPVLKPVELKIAHRNPQSDESLLRAILEVHTYSQALKQVLETAESCVGADRQTQSLLRFLGQGTVIRPTVLVERQSRAGRELLDRNGYPEVHKLAAYLSQAAGTGMEFYVYDYPHQYPDGYLYTPISGSSSPRWRIELLYPTDFVAEPIAI